MIGGVINRMHRGDPPCGTMPSISIQVGEPTDLKSISSRDDLIGWDEEGPIEMTIAGARAQIHDGARAGLKFLTRPEGSLYR